MYLTAIKDFIFDTVEQYLVVLFGLLLLLIFHRFIYGYMRKIYRFLESLPSKLESFFNRKQIEKNINERVFNQGQLNAIRKDIKKHLDYLENKNTEKKFVAMQYLTAYPSTEGHIAIAKTLREMTTMEARKKLMEDLYLSIDGKWYD